MRSPSKDNGLFDNSCEIGYPQGKNLSPATMRTSMRKATKSLPWSQAFAPSRSVFLKWPSPMIDFNRLNAISICQRPRYISSTFVGMKFRSRVVKTNVYPAASIVSGLTVAPFRLFSWRALRRAFSAASLLFFNAQTLPARSVFSYGTHTSQSPNSVLVNVLKRRNKGKGDPSLRTSGRFVKLILTNTCPPPWTTCQMSARRPKFRSPKNKSPGWTVNRSKDSPISGLVTYTSSHCKEGNPIE